jgi:hypothetical protein
VRLVWLERIAVAVCSIGLAVVLIVLLSGYFTTNDQPAVSGRNEVGFQYVDQGDELLAPGSRYPRYDSNPPTSGPHVPVPVPANERALSDDQILGALAAGDVVILYSTPSPPPGLLALGDSIAGPFSPALAAAGDAVVLARRAGTRGLLALAWTRLLSVAGPSDPLLRQFIQDWLGRGATKRGAVPGTS